ncbi:MAG: O-antigen ligase family protein [Pseudomonadota bacterium]
MRINSQYLLGWLNRQNLLVAGTLLLTVSPFLSVAFYVGAALRTAFGEPTIVLTKERKVLTGILFIISIWFAGHNFLPEEIGPGKVAFTDYVPLFWFFYAVSLRPFSTGETKKILYAFMFTIPQQFIVALGENYLHWQGRFYFPARKFPFLDIYYGPSEVGLATSASFFNPNILALYAIMGAIFSICLLLKEREQSGIVNTSPLWRWRIPFLNICLAFSLLLLIWTHSRNAWFFLLFIILIFSWLGENKPLKILGIGLSLVTLFALFNLFFPTPIAKYFLPDALSAKLTVFSSDREIFYKFAWDLIKKKPLVGWGIGMFPHLVSSKLWYQVLHTHSIFFQLAIEIGLPFAIGVLGLLLLLIISTGKRVARMESSFQRKEILDRGLLIACIVIFLMQFFDLALLMTYRLNFLFWLCLAIPYSKVSRLSTGKESADELD